MSQVDVAAAAIAGVVAAQCMEVPAYAQHLLGVGARQDVFAENGAILRAPPRYRRLAGWLAHAAAAVGIVLLYATFFAAVGNEHLLWWGVCAGAVHGALGGLVIGAWHDLHPEIPHELPDPGVFYRHYGPADVLTFCAGHLLFGAVAGTTYGMLHQTLTTASVL